MTPLSCAGSSGHLGALKMLLDAGADFELPDNVCMRNRGGEKYLWANGVVNWLLEELDTTPLCCYP